MRIITTKSVAFSRLRRARDIEGLMAPVLAARAGDSRFSLEAMRRRAPPGRLACV